MKLDRKMFLCGDMVDVHKCDMCKLESDKGEFGWPGHFYWAEKDFSLCCDCIMELHDSSFGSSSPKNRMPNSTNSIKKIPIPSELRWEVWERDNFTCVQCGSRRSLSVDHKYPESKGGETVLINLQTLCKSCNSKKAVREPEFKRGASPSIKIVSPSPYQGEGDKGDGVGKPRSKLLFRPHLCRKADLFHLAGR